MKNNKKFLDALSFIANLILTISIVWLGIFNVNGFQTMRYLLVILGIIALIGIISSKFGSWLGSKVSDIRTKAAERKRLKEEERLKAKEVEVRSIAGMNEAEARETLNNTSDSLVKELCNERLKVLEEATIAKMSEEEAEERLYSTSDSRVAELCGKRLDELKKIKELRAKHPRTKAKQVEPKAESAKTK